MGKIAILTPTGEREFCLNRCKYYIERQSHLPDYWIISDNGKIKTAKNVSSDKVNTIHGEHPGHSNIGKSFTGNILNILSMIPDDVEYCIVFEDDDWYHPSYIENTLDRLTNFDLVGMPYALYYNVRTRSYRKNNNEKRASLCETAFHVSVCEALAKCCHVKRESAFVDARLWEGKIFKGSKHLFADKRLVVGMKGLPGRKGVGIGHRAPNYKKDLDFSYLRSIIGKEDALWYQQIKY